jgi:predicted nucleotidyltransferase
MDSTIDDEIRRMIQSIVEGYQPQKVILFGSLVYGKPNVDSDIDLLIIKETKEAPLDRRVKIRQLVHDPRRRMALSPLVLTPEELELRLAKGDPFYREIISRGRILYAHG